MSKERNLDDPLSAKKPEPSKAKKSSSNLDDPLSAKKPEPSKAKKSSSNLDDPLSAKKPEPSKAKKSSSNLDDPLSAKKSEPGKAKKASSNLDDPLTPLPNDKVTVLPSTQKQRKQFSDRIKDELVERIDEVHQKVASRLIRNDFADTFDDLLMAVLESSDKDFTKYRLYLLALIAHLDDPNLDNTIKLLNDTTQLKDDFDDESYPIMMGSIQLMLSQYEVTQFTAQLNKLITALHNHTEVKERQEVVDDAFMLLKNLADNMSDMESCSKKCTEYFKSHLLDMYKKYPVLWQGTAEGYVRLTDDAENNERKLLMTKLSLDGDDSVKEVVDFLDIELDSLDDTDVEGLGLLDDTLEVLDDVVKDKERKNKSIGERMKALHDRWNAKSTSSAGRKIAVALMVIGALAIIAGCALMLAMTFSPTAVTLPALVVKNYVVASGSLVLGGAVTTGFGGGLFRHAGPSHTANKVGDVESSYDSIMTAAAG